VTLRGEVECREDEVALQKVVLDDCQCMIVFCVYHCMFFEPGFWKEVARVVVRLGFLKQMNDTKA
jgi:hypothetical protein